MLLSCRISATRPDSSRATRNVIATVASIAAASGGYTGTTDPVRRGIGFSGVIALARFSRGPGSRVTFCAASPATTASATTPPQSAIRVESMRVSFRVTTPPLGESSPTVDEADIVPTPRRNQMKRLSLVFAFLLLGASVLAQRPSDPALLVPETAPELDYVAVADGIVAPPEMKM